MSFLKPKTFRLAACRPLPNDVYRFGSSALQPPSATSFGVAASATHIVCPYGSKGTLAVLSTATASSSPSSSAISRSTPLATINAHAQDVSDVHFSPFDDAQLASAGADGTVKLWSLPSQATTLALSTPVAKFDGYENVSTVRYHPSASSVLAVGHKSGLALLDVEAGSAKSTFSISGYGKDVVSVSWSRSGALLAALTKNSTISCFDPRTADAAVLTSGAVTPSIKKTHHVMHLGSPSTAEFLCLFGLSASHRPVVQFFDPRSLAMPLLERDFDFSNGFVMPMYDPDTNVLFITVRGSNVVSLFDVEPDKGRPFMHPFHSFTCDSPFKGAALVGKRGVDINQAEIDRIVLLGADTVESISVQVPRKTSGFHEELYPETASLSPASTAVEYFSGVDRLPTLGSIAKLSILASNGVGVASAAVPSPTSASSAPKLTVQTGASSSSPALSSSSPSGAASSASSSNAFSASPRSAVSVASPTAAATAAAAYTPSNVRSTIDSVLRKSKFVHTSCTEPLSQHDTYFDLKLSSTLPLAQNLRANDRFFAVPWAVSGGSAVAVFTVGKVGRTPINMPCFKGHKTQVSSFDLSLLDEHAFVSASYEGDIRLHRIPDGGLTKDVLQADDVLQVEGKVSLVRFHPYAPGVLICAYTSFDGNVLEMWDLATKQARWSVNVHADVITDVSVHPHGHMLATTCKDGKARIVHVGDKRVVHEFVTPEGTRDSHIVWVSPNHVVTTGFGTASQRSISMWDVSGGATSGGATKSPLAPLQTFALDRGNNIPMPRYDEDSKLLFVANYGGSFEQLFEVNESAAPYLTLLNTFQTSKDAVGLALLSKHVVDVKKCEVVRALKLTKDAVQPISHVVPRKRLELFQDDVFVPTRAKKPLFSADDLFSGKYAAAGKKDCERVSLQPSGTVPLSQAPEEGMTDRQKRYQEQLQKAAAAKAAPTVVGATGHATVEEVKNHFLSMAATAGGGNRWDARQDKTQDVADDEWDD